MTTAKVLFNGQTAATAVLESSGTLIALSGGQILDPPTFERIVNQEQCQVMCGDKVYNNCTLVTYDTDRAAMTFMPDVE